MPTDPAPLPSCIVQLLKALPWAAVVEKASIDEAYILLAAPLDDALGPLGGEGGAAGGEVALAQLALQRAQEAKAAGGRPAAAALNLAGADGSRR